MTNESIQKVKERAQALLRKAADTACSPEEAFACMQKARKLMEQFALSEDDLKARPQDAFTQAEFTGKQTADGSYIVHPVDRLSGVTIGRFCGVKPWLACKEHVIKGKLRRESTGCVYFGQEVDVEFATWFRASIIEQLEEAWTSYKRYKMPSARLMDVKVARTAFVRAYCSGINERLQDWLYRDEPTSDGKNTEFALVTRKHDLIEAELRNRGMHFVHEHRKRTAAEDAIAANAGYEQAKAATFGRGVKPAGMILIGG